MDKYAFASELSDVLFYSSYNVILQQKLGESSLSWDNLFACGVMVFGIVAVIFSVIGGLVTSKKYGHLWWTINGVSVGSSTAGVILAIFLLIANTSGITRGHYENTTRWQDLHLDAEELVADFRGLSDDAPIASHLVTRLGSIKRKREVLETRELWLPAPSRKLEMECFEISTERIYGIGIKTQEGVEKLKKENFERWARGQIMVDPRDRRAS
jgi:hypothetical protein